MLKLDLSQLDRRGRLLIEEDVPPDDPLWQDGGIHLRGPLAVRLEAQRAGADVVVRGRVKGEIAIDCRRCLVEVAVPVDETVTLVFRAGVTPEEAERQDVYPLPGRTRELDLGGPVREHVLLAAPQFVICRDTCRGLCPQCGANLNEGECDCRPTGSDDRWAPLRKLKLD